MPGLMWEVMGLGGTFQVAASSREEAYTAANAKGALTISWARPYYDPSNGAPIGAVARDMVEHATRLDESVKCSWNDDILLVANPGQDPAEIVASWEEESRQLYHERWLSPAALARRRVNRDKATQLAASVEDVAFDDPAAVRAYLRQFADPISEPEWTEIPYLAIVAAFRRRGFEPQWSAKPGEEDPNPVQRVLGAFEGLAEDAKGGFTDWAGPCRNVMREL